MSVLMSIAVAATVIMLVASIAFFVFVAIAPNVSEKWASELGASVDVTDADSSGRDRGGSGTV